jgi:hypothetical protein
MHAQSRILWEKHLPSKPCYVALIVSRLRGAGLCSLASALSSKFIKGCFRLEMCMYYADQVLTTATALGAVADLWEKDAKVIGRTLCRVKAAAQIEGRPRTVEEMCCTPRRLKAVLD